MTDSDKSVELVTRVAAALRNDADDLSLYSGFLINTLTQAVPAELIEIDRKQSFAQRVRGQDGEIVGVHIVLGDTKYSLTRPTVGASSTATLAHTVNGIVLSRTTVGLDEWATKLSQALLAQADANSSAAANLARAFGLSDPS